MLVNHYLLDQLKDNKMVIRRVKRMLTNGIKVIDYYLDRGLEDKKQWCASKRIKYLNQISALDHSIA